MNPLINPSIPFGEPEDLPVVPFTRNWNHKLHCDCMTTFRLHNPRRYFVSARLRVTLSKWLTKTVEVVQVRTMRLGEVDEWTARLDTGMGRDEFIAMIRDMYANKGIDFETQLWDLVLTKTVK